jgi:hypothetical protein
MREMHVWDAGEDLSVATVKIAGGSSDEQIRRMLRALPIARKWELTVEAGGTV